MQPTQNMRLFLVELVTYYLPHRYLHGEDEMDHADMGKEEKSESGPIAWPGHDICGTTNLEEPWHRP